MIAAIIKTALRDGYFTGRVTFYDQSQELYADHSALKRITREDAAQDAVNLANDYAQFNDIEIKVVK